MSEKAAIVVFHVRLNEAVYSETKRGKLTLPEAAKRISQIYDEVHARWPHKEKEARALIGIPSLRDIPKFDKEHEELLNWAIWNVVHDDTERAN